MNRNNETTPDETVVSIIVVTYNSAGHIENCLSSIERYCKPRQTEVIVVDNASQDSTIDIARSFDGVFIIESGINLGFGKANNIGVTAARGEYVFFLNPDTFLLDDAPGKLLQAWRAGSKGSIGALGAALLSPNRKPNISYGSFRSPFTRAREIIIEQFKTEFNLSPYKETYIDEEKSIQKVDYVSGADLFMEKATFLALSGFDENFFMYCEELDLQLRLREQLNQPSYVVPSVKIIHLEGQSSRLGSAIRKRINLETSYVYFYRKHFHYAYVWLYKIIIINAFSVICLADLFLRNYKFREHLKLIRSIQNS